MRNETVYGNGFFAIVKAVLLALGISLLASVIFAVILQSGHMNEGGVYAITQTIKGISIAIGAVVFVRGEKGWLKGGGVGLLYTALSYLAFSSLGGDFSLTWLIFAELAIAFTVGMIGGILAVNLKR